MTHIELGRRIAVTELSQVIHKEDLGWGTHGYVIELQSGGWSGYIPTRDEAIWRALMEWPMAADDLTST